MGAVDQYNTGEPSNVGGGDGKLAIPNLQTQIKELKRIYTENTKKISRKEKNITALYMHGKAIA